MNRFVMGIAACLLAVPALAFSPDFKAIEDDAVPNRYPEGSIQSRETADRAVADVKKARNELAKIADYSTRRCYSNFFVNSCIEDVRKAKMRQEARLKKVEAQAKSFIREDKHQIEVRKQAERDRRAAEKHGRPEVPAKEALPPPPPLTQATGLSKGGERAHDRQQRHEQALANAPAQQAAHEQRVAKKRAEAEERQKRAEEQAAERVERHEKALAERDKRRQERDQKMRERREKNAQSEMKDYGSKIPSAAPQKASK